MPTVTIALNGRGDIWTVQAEGGVAMPHTLDPAHDYHDVW